MPDVQTAKITSREGSPLRDTAGLPSVEEAAWAAAFAAADREAEMSGPDLSPPESRGVVWEDSLGFPDGDIIFAGDVEDYCAELVFWLTDFSDAEEGLSNWTVFR